MFVIRMLAVLSIFAVAYSIGMAAGGTFTCGWFAGIGACCATDILHYYFERTQ